MTNQPALESRQTPESIDFEANLLGCVMLDPSLLEDAPPVYANDFFYDHHAHIWLIVSTIISATKSCLNLS